MPKLQPGDKAPDFTLPAVDGSQFTLSYHLTRGPVLLTFYRGDFCPVCNLYLRSLQDRVEQFQEAGAQIVAISSDQPDLAQHTVQRQQLAFPVLSDPERRVVKVYDVVYNELEGHAEPAVFVISPEGAIVYESIIGGPIGRPTPDDPLKIVQMARPSRKASPGQAA